MNLTQLAKLCSLCNLMTYAFIDAAVIGLRLKNVTNQEELEIELRQKQDGGGFEKLNLHGGKKNKLSDLLKTWSPWTFLVVAFFSALSIGNSWSLDARLILGAALLINFVVL